jgi:hypothetical protein
VSGGGPSRFLIPVSFLTPLRPQVPTGRSNARVDCLWASTRNNLSRAPPREAASLRQVCMHETAYIGQSDSDDDLSATVSSSDLGDRREHLAERVSGPDHWA